MGFRLPSIDDQTLSGGTSRYRTWIEVLTDDGLVYAQGTKQLGMLDRASGSTSFHEDVVTGRGYVRLSWTVLDGATMQPTSCDPDSVFWDDDTLFRCPDGMAMLPGFAAGTYDIHATLCPGYYTSNPIDMETIAGVAVQPGQVTDVPVTFVTP